MIYTVKLHRVTLLVLVAGLLVVFGLIFFAGMLAGVHRAQPHPEETAPPESAPEQPVSEQPGDETAAAEPAAAVPQASFAVQVAVFTTAEDAAAKVEELTARGYQPYVVTLRADRRQTLLRSVRLGPFAGRRAAEKAALGFEIGEGRETSIVREAAPPASAPR